MFGGGRGSGCGCAGAEGGGQKVGVRVWRAGVGRWECGCGGRLQLLVGKIDQKLLEA